jgi:hypothetical protein
MGIALFGIVFIAGYWVLRGAAEKWLLSLSR